jgi:DNA-binding NtrC family response regulator
MSVVLVVEDEMQVLILAESVLQEAGYETASASTVAEALAIIESPDRQLDLLFTDITLRDDTDGGLMVGTAFAKSRPGAPVLYTTARGVTDGMVALFVQPNGFVAKPYTVEQLKTAVANLVSP